MNVRVYGFEVGTLLYETPHFQAYRATRQRDGWPVALKVSRVSPELSVHAQALRAEHALLTGLGGEGVPGPIALLEMSAGAVLVHELPRGEWLSELLEKPLPLPEVLRLGLGLCRSLGALHDRRLVHGALRPEVVWLERATGHVTLADLSRAFDLGRTGQRPLLPVEERDLAHVAPEQTGRTHHRVDHRTDLYAVGLLLYQALTGHLPFSAQNPLALVHSHLAIRVDASAGALRHVPEPVARIVLKLLSKNLTERYRGTAGLATDLDTCARELSQGGSIPPFDPGQQDPSPRPEPPLHPHARDMELRALETALEPVRAGGRAFVAVRGASGMGKTSLVREAFRGAPGLRLISSKLDALTGGTPYEGVLEACRELVHQILAEPDSWLAAWRERLAAADPDSGAVAALLLPELLPLLGPTALPAPVLDPSESSQCIPRAFRDLLASVALPERPLVVLMDDLHRADPGTLGLVQRLLEDADSHHLLVVAAYQDVLAPEHALRQLPGALREAGVAVHELELGPLCAAEVAGLVGRMLALSPHAVRPLADAVREKTHGNPLFTVEFVRGLHADAVLRFDSTARQWHWDLEQLRERPATDNVRDLMHQRLEMLEAETREALAVAACAGHAFDVERVAAAAGTSSATVATHLETLRDQSILVDSARSQPEAPGRRRYRFVHDQVQEAAWRLLPENRRARVHLALGHYLLSLTSGEPDDASLYAIVGHLSRGLSAMMSSGERLELARLGIRAGQRASASAAFEDAHTYLSSAVALLPQEAWAEHHALAFVARLALAECDYRCGRIAQAELRFGEVLAQARTDLERAEVHGARSALLGLQDRNEEALDTVLAGLRLLGVRIAPRPGLLPVLGTFLQSGFQLWRIGLDRFAQLPPMKDPAQRIAMRLLMHLSVPAARLNREVLTLVQILTMLSLSLRGGNAPESPIGYAIFAQLFIRLFGKSRLGYEMSCKALALAECGTDERVKSRVMVIHAGFTSHLYIHLGDSIALLEQAHRLAARSGDPLFATYANGGLLTMMVSVGHPIPRVYERALEALRYARRVGRDESAANAWQVMLWAEQLGGLELRAPGTEPPPPTHLAWSALLRELLNIQAAYLMGDLDSARRSAETVLRKPMILRLASCYREYFTFYHVLILAALAGPKAPRSTRRALRKAEGYFQGVAARCPANGAHRHLLVSAERARLEGRNAEAAADYARAIDVAEASGCVHEAALARELAGRFYLRTSELKSAAACLRAAQQAYARWGARRKVARLEAEFAPLLGGPALPGAATPDGLRLDLDSVIKASRAISSELVLDALLSRLMRLLIENAGAERGLLVTESSGTLVIEAEGDVQGAGPSRPPVAVDGDPRLPASIVHYVMRTGDSVMLEDAVAQEGPFARDPYMAARRPRSVLCAPLSNQGRLIALLYLENNLTVGAFTRDRLAVLTLLLSQAALSLHNARLYASLHESNTQLEEYSRTLEQRVEERTSELRNTQKKLVIQEKLASLGALTSGIAHELRNPLNFIKNFAESSDQLVQDVAERLAAGTLTAPDEALDDLTQNMARINRHARRASTIIESMLLHARSSGRSEFAPTDFNGLVAQTLHLVIEAASAREPKSPVRVNETYDVAAGTVEVVEQELRRVLLNLCENAFYALRQKGQSLGPGFSPSLTVRTIATGEQVELRLRDNGTGIPRSVVEHIYEPFFTTKPPGEGTGLGLSLSHDIVVSRHGGELRVETVPGEFTEFIVVLPRRAGARLAAMGT